MKSFKKEIYQIHNIMKKIDKNQFNYRIVVTELVFLILKTEKILFDNNLKKHPNIYIRKFLKDLILKLSLIIELKDFQNDKKISKQSFILEKTHRSLFNNLWSYFNEEEYKKERIGRYIKRIKINNLKKIIKGKNCVDFGCGHGNFLSALVLLGAKSGTGIDYGNKSIAYAKKITKKLKLEKKIKFYCKSAYKTGLKKNTYDFAIQNGVFHHMKFENKAYKEVYRVLKKNGYFWIYTDGGGGIRDFINDLCQNILKTIDDEYVVKIIRSMNLSKNKVYHLSDHMNAKYRHTTKNELVKRLKRIGFDNFKQINGGMKTDLDKPFVKDKYFNIKFGSGDLRFLCQKT